MLSFKNRLKRKKDFEKIYSDGKSANADSIFLKFIKNNKTETRIGFVVSKKVSNKAVERNLIKRILRNYCREKISEMVPGLDIVVIAKKEIKNLSKEEIYLSLEEVFRKEKIIN